MSLENVVDESAAAMMLDFHPSFAGLRRRRGRTSLQWTALTVRVGDKTLLAGVSGRVGPGDVCAVMGGSGAGKTTLIEALAGRRVHGVDGYRVEGTFRVNGEEIKPAAFRKRVAFVPQSDVLYATATARESLDFSAKLRLAKSVGDEERKRLVDDMIESLGLKKCQDTAVGSETLRGLSGGERKRVAIGVELVSNPSCLFLDEPTSGLDSFSAWKVARILRSIADEGACTILCSIHQPSTEVFREFSQLILMQHGHVVYQGPTSEVDAAFRAAKMGVPPHTNPADHIIFLVQTRDADQLPNDDGDTRRPAAAAAAADLQGAATQSERDEVSVGMGKKPGFLIQCAWLAKREAMATIRDPDATIARYGGLVALSVIVACIFIGAGNQASPVYSVNTHFTALAMIWILIMLTIMEPSLLTFPTERVIFVRENATGTYSVAAYVFSKMVLEVPNTFLCSLFSMLICYWAMSLGGSFILLTLCVWAVALMAVSTAYVLGTVVKDAKAAMELETPIVVSMILFLGAVIRLQQIPVWLRWIQYLVSAKYPLNLASAVEFSPSRASNATVAQEWAALLSSNDMYADLEWFYIFMIFVFYFGLRVLSVLLLMQQVKRF